MKKIIISLMCIISLILSGTPVLAEENTKNHSDELLSKTVDYLYYDIDTHTIYESQSQVRSSRKLYEIRREFAISQVSGTRYLKARVTLTGLDYEAHIQGISGTVSFKDTQSYGASNVSINRREDVPSYRFNAEKRSGREFTKGHKIHCEASYYIYLVDGEVMNGGKSIQSVDVVIK